ncbi:hypothetical protein GTW71_28030, partial [Streptomyces sp. SID6041]|nr:hypothetical protein [Streptomyces sp. SID6041]
AGPAGAAPGAGAAGFSRGDTAVGGSALPPFIRAVGASAPTCGGGVSSSSVPDNGGANTVAGNGTAPSTPPALALASAQGLDAGGGVEADGEVDAEGGVCADGGTGGAGGAAGAAGVTGAAGAGGAA